MIVLRRYAAITLCFATAFCAMNACRKPTASYLAITHVTVIDMTGAPPAPDQTVLIEKEKIVAAGASPSVAVPPGATIVDGSGKFLIPGLADMHIHLTGAGEPDGSRKFILPLLVANGITTVRDMGGYLDSLIPLRREIEEGKRIGPSIAFAGPYLDGEPPAFAPAMIVTNRDDAEAAVSWLKQRGVDFVKVQSNLSRDAYFAIADAARNQNMQFVGHVPDRVTAWEATDAGQRSIEHLTNVLRACSSQEARLMTAQFRLNRQGTQIAWQRELLDTYSEANAAKLAARFRERQTWQTPTLVLLRNVAFPAADSDLASDPRTNYVPRKLLAGWQEGHVQQINGATREQFSIYRALLEKSHEIVAQMQRAGVKILAGTDSTAPYVFPGSSLHEELALLVQAGMTPIKALQTATRNPADFLGRLDSQGTIAVGKNADLILLDANPLDDIRNTQKIRAVFLRGKLLERSALDQLLAGAEQFAARN